MNGTRGHRFALAALGFATAAVGAVSYSLKRLTRADLPGRKSEGSHPAALSGPTPLVKRDAAAPSKDPEALALAYPPSAGIGEAELTVKDDGSWSVNVTVTPIRADRRPAEPTTEPGSQEGDLPPLVSMVRDAILEAARASDYEELEEVAFAGSDDFLYSFEEPVTRGHPGRYWQALEERGQEVLPILIKLLELPYARLDDLYIWPSVAALGLSHIAPSDREILRRAFGEELVAFWEEIGAYLHYRVGVTSLGDWLFFVPSD